jgi:sugar phosphate isomerase/epimerase
MRNITIGIMQGRLSNKDDLPLQSFPAEWKKEFKYASQLGVRNIEWLLDGKDDNPISKKKGRDEIRRLSVEHNISVSSLCAHQLMSSGLFEKGMQADNALKQFIDIVAWSNQAGIKNIILPVMEELSIKPKYSKDKLKSVLQNIVEPSGPMILLESDLPMKELCLFLEEVAMDNVRVLYDLGNATAQQHDLINEIKQYHHLISEIHVKDRYYNGGSDRLGRADVNFNLIAKILNKVSWNGLVVLETPVFSDWKSEAEYNISFTKNWVNKIMSGREEI